MGGAEMIKAFCTSIESSGGYSGIFHHTFGLYFESVSLDRADFVFVVLENCHNWAIDSILRNLINTSGKPVAVFDYWEEAWNELAYRIDTHGLQNIKAVFKREMVKNHTYSGNIHPIDWYNHIPVPEPDTFEEFNARPIDILMIWGLSNPIRPEVHGNLMAGCHKHGWTYIGNRHHIAYEGGQKAVLLHQPHYDRIPEKEMYELQSKSKITISLPGAGVKCFRHAEAPINSVMAKPEDNLVWQAGWDKTNCVFFSDSVVEIGCLIDYGNDLKYELSNPETLYQKYLNGTKRAHEIKPEKVWNTHILPKIL